MSDSVRPRQSLTVEEYLAFEETATVKHEYVGGHVYAMTGTTKRHNRIMGNVLFRLGDAAEDGPCEVYFSSVKLRVAGDVIYYPDIIVTCEPDEDPLIEEYPCLVVEVVSPKTENTDRREKLLAYRQLASLGAYLVVAQDRRWIERHFRGEGGAWRHEDHVGEGPIPVPCPRGALLMLDDVYRGIDLTR